MKAIENNKEDAEGVGGVFFFSEFGKYYATKHAPIGTYWNKRGKKGGVISKLAASAAQNRRIQESNAIF